MQVSMLGIAGLQCKYRSVGLTISIFLSCFLLCARVQRNDCVDKNRNGIDEYSQRNN